MKMSKKSLAAILAAAMMTTAFASCGSNESGNTSGNASGDADAPYTFKVISENSADDPTSDVHPVKLALDDYIKDHPNFSYEFETVKKYDIASKIAILISSNDVPDMFTYEDGTSLDALIERDAIVDIDEDFSRIGVELEDVVLPGAINSKHVLSNHEHIYSLPMQLTTNGVWYNKQLFEEKGWSVPASWQEFQQLCADIKEAGVQPLACNGSDKWPITRWMRDQFAAGLNMAVAGIPWWTTDIGGFNGGYPDDPAFRELLIRWFEYGTFCPVMRLHGYRLPYEDPMSNEVGGGMCDSGAPNEIWSFGEKAYPILKEHIELRERLRPYIRRLMKDAHEKGTPPMRPMFYDYPEDKNCWDVEDAYMFGPNLLIAPVMYAGMKQRDVYLPEGSEWIEVSTGKHWDGGSTAAVSLSLDHIPVFTNSESMLSVFRKG